VYLLFWHTQEKLGGNRLANIVGMQWLHVYVQLLMNGLMCAICIICITMLLIFSNSQSSILILLSHCWYVACGFVLTKDISCQIVKLIKIINLWVYLYHIFFPGLFSESWSLTPRSCALMLSYICFTSAPALRVSGKLTQTLSKRMWWGGLKRMRNAPSSETGTNHTPWCRDPLVRVIY